MRHRLSTHAERDLVDIYLWTHGAFGERQADKYLQELERVFELIAENPRMGRLHDTRTRKVVHGRHVIFYRLVGEVVVIGRILHGARGRLER